MRTYGRVPVWVTPPSATSNGVPLIDPKTGKQKRKWVVIETAADGDNTAIWLTTLCQVLLLNLNESPFWGNYGIPARQAVAQQLSPDFWVSLTQQNFAQYFAALTVSKRQTTTPTYDISVITKQGAQLNFTLGVPF